MLVTPEDIKAAYPGDRWLDYKLSVSLDLVDGRTVILRASIRDMQGMTGGLSWQDVSSAVGGLSSQDVAEAITSSLEAQLLLVAKDQLRLATLARAIMEDVDAKMADKDLLL